MRKSPLLSKISSVHALLKEAHTRGLSVDRVSGEGPSGNSDVHYVYEAGPLHFTVYPATVYIKVVAAAREFHVHADAGWVAEGPWVKAAEKALRALEGEVQACRVKERNAAATVLAEQLAWAKSQFPRS